MGPTGQGVINRIGTLGPLPRDGDGLTATAQGRGRRRRGSVEEAELVGDEAEKVEELLLRHF
jgi:hypothetical protein